MKKKLNPLQFFETRRLLGVAVPYLDLEIRRTKGREKRFLRRLKKYASTPKGFEELYLGRTDKVLRACEW